VRGQAGWMVSVRSSSGWQPSRLAMSAGFADRGADGLVVARAQQAGGVVEQAMSEVVGGGVLAQLGDRGGERRAGAVVGGGEAGAGQVTFGTLHRGQLPRPVPVEQGQNSGAVDKEPLSRG